MKENSSSSKKFALLLLIGSLAMLGLAYNFMSPTITGMVTGADQNLNSNSNINSNIENSLDVSIENNILALRKASISGEIEQIAKLYTILDEEIPSSSRSNWRVVANCVYSSCEDINFLRLMKAVVNDKDDDNSYLIYNVIETNELWNARNEAVFSRYLTTTSNLVSQRNEPIRNKWTQIVNCNGCDDLDDLTFEFIELTLNNA